MRSAPANSLAPSSASVFRAERTENDPVDAASGIIVDQPEDRSAAANFNVIRVSAKAEDRERTILFEIELQIDHGFWANPCRSAAW